jgi:hypothetical protein
MYLTGVGRTTNLRFSALTPRASSRPAVRRSRARRSSMEGRFANCVQRPTGELSELCITGRLRFAARGRILAELRRGWSAPAA